MIKGFIDILWIITSMSFYFLFCKVSNKALSLFGNAVIYGHSFSIDYLLISALILITFPLLYLYTISIKANDTLKVKSLKIAEPIYIPVYIGYFVIATSINDKAAFFIISAILILLIWRTKIFYFNPILFLFGYNFYEIQDDKETNMLLISKKSNLKGSKKFDKLHRLNNFVFLDKSEEVD